MFFLDKAYIQTTIQKQTNKKIIFIISYVGTFGKDGI